MEDKSFYASFVCFFLNESFTLNEIEALEEIFLPLPTAAVKEDTNMFSSELGKGPEKGLVFGL